MGAILYGPIGSLGNRFKLLCNSLPLLRHHHTPSNSPSPLCVPGDVINVHDKQEDGWWLGELNGTVGIFPATYVLELT